MAQLLDADPAVGDRVTIIASSAKGKVGTVIKYRADADAVLVFLDDVSGNQWFGVEQIEVSR